MPDLAISNTSPLFYLHRLRQIDLLRRLYGQIVVPEGVRDELHVGRVRGEDAPEIAEYEWIEVRYRDKMVMIDLTPYQSSIAEICQALGIRRLELIGSATRDDFRPDSSDIDMLVEFGGDTDLFHRYFDLKARLESLFERKVDVIQAGAIKNPYVQETIDRDRMLIYRPCCSGPNGRDQII